MRNVYRVLAGLVALGVVVQAASMVYAVAGLGKWIDEGNTATKDIFEDDSLSFTGLGGFMLHGMNGMMFIPLIALLLLIVSFFAKVPGGVKWAGLVFLDVVLQVTLGLFGHEVPAIGALHGINALVLFGLAVMTFLRSKETAVGTPAATTGTATHV